MGYNLQRMGEQYPWSPQFHSLYDKELNGNYVQLSTIPTQSSNLLFSENTAEKGTTQMSYYDFRDQKKFQFVLFNRVAYNIIYFDGNKYSE